jgi:dGTPase
VLGEVRSAERDRFLALERKEGKHANTLHKSFDCAIMDCADDIAYGVHDLEDAIALGFVSEGEFRIEVSADVAADYVTAQMHRPLVPGGRGDYDELVARLFGTASARKGAIGRLVHYFIRSVEAIELPEFDTPLLRWRVDLCPEAKPFLQALKKLIVAQVINSPRVQHLEFKGQRMVVAMFEAIASDPHRLLPEPLARAYREADEPLRILCDHVASFTDGALLRTYERLFSPRMGSVFDRI